MDFQSNIKTWFAEEVYFWRLSYSLLCLILIQASSSLALCFLINVNILHPLTWLQDNLSMTFSMATVGYNMILSSFIIGLTLIHSYNYDVVPRAFLTRCQLIWNILKPLKLLIVCFYAISGSIFVLLYLATADSSFSALTVVCPEESTKLCVNEGHLFLVLYGAYVGVWFGVNLFASNCNYVCFPIIQQSKFFQVKLGLSSMIKESLLYMIRSSKWFLAFYAICGPSVQIWITDLLQLRLRSYSTLIHLRNLVHLELWWVALLTGTTIHYLFCMIAFVFKVFQTERISFPITSPFQEESCRTLKAAMTSTDLPLLQYLGYLDMTLSAKHSPSWRKEVFEISQPGGHPHHWNSIVKECLGQIKTTINCLNSCIEPPLGTNKFQPLEPSLDTKTKSLMSPCYEKWRLETFYSDTLITAKSLINGSQGVGDGPKVPGTMRPIPTMIMKLKASLKNAYQMLWTAFLNIRLISYFVKEAPEARVRKVFAECQLTIWAIEALSFLISASLCEDRYGVVQRDLAEVLTALLDLQQTLNKIQKFETTTSKRSPSLHCQEPDVSLKVSLKCSLKLALYRITTIFKSYISSIDVSADHHKVLTRYAQCKE